MKFICLILSLSSFISLASVKKTIRCLAKEEDKYHKNQSQGPFYFLNQILINKMVNYDSLKIQPDIVKKVCQTSQPKSLTLIEQYILYPDNFFVTLKEVEEQKSFQQKEELANFYKLTFFNLLIKMQEYSGTKECFKQVFPNSAKIFDQIKYTQVDINLIGIIDRIENKRDLMAKMWNVPAIFNQCKKKKTKK